MQQRNESSDSALTIPLFGDWMKSMMRFSSPPLSIERWIASHQRNCEAASKMAALATESMSSILHHQLDAAGSLAKEGLGLLNQLVETGTGTEKLNLQAEWAKDRLDKGMSSLRHLSDIAAAANREAGRVLAERLNESFEEFNSNRDVHQ